MALVPYGARCPDRTGDHLRKSTFADSGATGISIVAFWISIVDGKLLRRNMGESACDNSTATRWSFSNRHALPHRSNTLQVRSGLAARFTRQTPRLTRVEEPSGAMSKRRALTQ